MAKHKILVTGGCGYIGSHVTRQLSEAGYAVTVLDNLSKGHPEALIHGEELVVGDIGDRETVRRLVKDHAFDAALHFAASIAVEESVSQPLDYYENNVAKSIALFDELQKGKVKRIVFSSTAAVYGEGVPMPVTESSALAPMSPYGHSKVMMEQVLRDASAAHGIRHIILRYFNVAGADRELRMGLRSKNATHLIKICCEAALGKRGGLTVNGEDYDTRDGSCIRDYIHIEDLAAAHLKALEHLLRDGDSKTLNCGYGRGYTVKEVVEAFKRVNDVDFSVEKGPRRPGDVPEVIADASRIKAELGWEPKFDDLEIILRDSYAWDKKLWRTP